MSRKSTIIKGLILLLIIGGLVSSIGLSMGRKPVREPAEVNTTEGTQKKAQIEKYVKEEIIFIPWGSGDDEIGLWEIKLTPDLLQAGIDSVPPPKGPLTFTVDEKENIYIMDNVNKAVKKFDSKGRYIGIIVSNASARAIEVDSNENLYLLSGYSIRHYSKNGDLVNIFQISRDIDLIGGYGQGLFLDKAGNLIVNRIQETYRIGVPFKIKQGKNQEISSLKALNPDQQLRSKGYGMLGITDTRFAVERRDNHTASIQILNNKTIALKEIIMQTTDEFGGILFLKQDNQGSIYIETERIDSDNYVHLEVRKYNPYTGDLLAIVELPNDYYTMVCKKIHVDNKGNLYHFITSEKGVRITKWQIK